MATVGRSWLPRRGGITGHGGAPGRGGGVVGPWRPLELLPLCLSLFSSASQNLWHPNPFFQSQASSSNHVSNLLSNSSESQLNSSVLYFELQEKISSKSSVYAQHILIYCQIPSVLCYSCSYSLSLTNRNKQCVLQPELSIELRPGRRLVYGRRLHARRLHAARGDLDAGAGEDLVEVALQAERGQVAEQGAGRAEKEEGEQNYVFLWQDSVSASLGGLWPVSAISAHQNKVYPSILPACVPQKKNSIQHVPSDFMDTGKNPNRRSHGAWRLYKCTSESSDNACPTIW